ncbi:hypothetical protein [Streptomyces sp. 35G-GA-8]|uniref:hypothetical protein n=1 Tax=Streptomyces sp. 35G-GA-8 TaxID=2939434 RepID=UPI00201F09F9|nr:hypothetical protein [Streptomyces sp. 35G-GA-8]MCL7377011.1 hypothetical protein [Streptomyces sp. 35G-GA-8]
MGLGIYVEDLWRGRMSAFTDDEEASFMRVCESAPEESLRFGVNKYGETLFNSIQLRQLVKELESLPEDDRTPVVQQVVDGARQAIHRTGYLHFIGD